jgi:vesicle coat complex subunit
LVGCRSSKTGDLRDVNELEKQLQDREPAVRAKAALDLSKHGAAAAKTVPALIEALKSNDSALRQNAALALGRIGPAANQAVPALTQALVDSEWTVRRHAVIALGEIGDPQALPAVLAAARDPDSLVRKAAAESAKMLQK